MSRTSYWWFSGCRQVLSVGYIHIGSAVSSFLAGLFFGSLCTCVVPVALASLFASLPEDVSLLYQTIEVWIDPGERISFIGSFCRDMIGFSSFDALLERFPEDVRWVVSMLHLF